MVTFRDWCNASRGLIASVAATCVVSIGSAHAEPLNQQVFDYLSVNVGSGLSGNAKLIETYDGEPDSVSGRQSTGLFGSVTVGRYYGNGVALELEAFGTNNHIKSASASDTTYGGLLNFTYTTPPLASLYPYFGAGAGYGGVTYSTQGRSISASGFFWQAKAGVLFPVTSSIDLDLGYRYLATPSLHTGGFNGGTSTKLSGDLNILSLGARLKF